MKYAEKPPIRTIRSEYSSGAQYIHAEPYAATIHKLEHPPDEILWLAATDPNQAWGKALAHEPGRQLTIVPSTSVALKRGVPVAVFERQGHTLRVFDKAKLPAALRAFAEAFSKRTVFPALKRLTVKQYPEASAEARAAAGFTQAMLDYVLYR
jgi:ATP-dependent Lhr-like helicase